MDSACNFSSIRIDKNPQNDQKKKIQSSADCDNAPVLETGMQKFDPSTSPPMNSFMDRLAVRNLLYQGK